MTVSNGDGNGDVGSGNGAGYGDGNGDVGSGNGKGNGYGNGNGYGDGYGIGDGDGYGYGNGNGYYDEHHARVLLDLGIHKSLHSLFLPLSNESLEFVAKLLSCTDSLEYESILGILELRRDHDRK